jgi:Phosphopantetheine attachment site
VGPHYATQAWGRITPPEIGQAGGVIVAPPNRSVSSMIELISQIWLDHTGQFPPWDCNFFDIGGSSILMAALRAEISGRMSREIKLLALYQHPCVRDLALHLAAECGDG